MRISLSVAMNVARAKVYVYHLMAAADDEYDDDTLFVFNDAVCLSTRQHQLQHQLQHRLNLDGFKGSPLSLSLSHSLFVTILSNDMNIIM